MNLSELLNVIELKIKSIVNIHIMDANFYNIPDLKLTRRQNIHHGEYCNFVKLNGKILTCTHNKERSKRIAQKGRMFSSQCPFGIWDLASPVMLNNHLTCIVYIGYFQGEKALSPVNGKEYPGPLPELITSEKRTEVRNAAKFITEFIKLSYQKWLADGNTMKKKLTQDYYKKFCLRYIKTHFHEPIQLQDLAGILKMNPNYLGDLIKRSLNENFTSLLNRTRIDNAKVFLKEKNFNITQVAFECGFCDSNYFSTVFKKYSGISPREYCKQFNQ